MAINFVQSRHLASGTIPFNSNNTLSNLLIVLAMDQSSGISSITCQDSQVNSYSALPLITQGGANICSQLFFCRSAKAGANTVTLTSSGVIAFGAIHEFSGVNTFDAGSFAVGNGNAQDSGGAVTSVAAELVFGYEFGNTELGQISVVGLSGMTQAEIEANAFLTQYSIVAATGTYNSATGTTTGKGGAANWIEQVATFFAGTISTATPNQAWSFGF